MIVSTTLTGSNAQIIGDALASVVDQVDRCLVIDTGARDDTLAVAARVAGDKLITRELTWTNDFAAARNFALAAAAELSATFALTVDTDERMLFDKGFDLRERLARTKANVLLVSYEDGCYAKERIVRLPAKVTWKGPTHEVLDGQRRGETELLAGVRFKELHKDAEAAKRKYERDVAMLQAHTRAHPNDPRWHYYLGASLHDLRRYEEAIPAFVACAALRGWAEEGAWACYRAAECYCALQRWPEAIEVCAIGLSIRPSTAELAWLAGWAAHKAGRHEDAIAWSKMAIANGLYEGVGKRYERIGFRHAPALWEGPYDVLRWSLAAVGDAPAAKAAERDWTAAKRARERDRR